MLEIPESNVIAKQLDKTIKGKTIKAAKANSSPHKFTFYFGEPQKYASLLKDRTIEYAKAYGGIIELTAGNVKIYFQDGVNARYIEKDGKIPEKNQLFIRFDDMSALVCTVQMYGMIGVFKDGENDGNKYYKTAKESVPVLSKAFNKPYFLSIFNKADKKLSSKAFLATQQRIPGLGNGVLQDILFNASIHPKTKLEKLKNPDITSMFDSLKNTLNNMTANGGRDTEKNLFGNKGGYCAFLSKNTVNTPCKKCGTLIKKEAYLGGSIYFCPKCQKEAK
ncbi:MAG: endonuclease VIII [Endomicrobia bacterium]|nr:endonuclease VIII [Endomicrobiia bacterium]